ncbi:hypothetical protein H4S02_001213 [Coemansia sp. RSA 2611]|nr:hypothetical protein H4S02_001213 [Coemansia sp. RSA 2611]
MARKRTRSEFEADLYQFDWSLSEGMSWSLTSLTTESSIFSVATILTPSTDLSPTMVSTANYSSNEDTLTETYPLEFSPLLISGHSTDSESAGSSPELDTPCARVSRKRKQLVDDETPTHKRRFIGKGQSATIHTVPTDSPSNSLNSHPRTPEKLAETYRPSGSPTRVSGTKVVTDINFADIGGNGVCKVDKTLVCKGFWDTINKAGRICLPRRSGKTYNLTQLLLFFSQSPEHIKVKDISDDVLLGKSTGPDDVARMDMPTKCRLKREALFRGSLLQTMHPEFFHEHFMRYPVLHLSLSEYFVANLYGRYILLIDEYDIPFITVHLANWSKEDKQAAQGILKLLFQTMLKDNDNLRKGLLLGVFEIPLTEMGSGANNIKDIRMVPTEVNDIESSILSADQPHTGSGIDALTDSFWFNAKEVELMLENSIGWCPRIARHKPFIMDEIRSWYNGYFIGRFRGKYNPWSVSSFIEELCIVLNQSQSRRTNIKRIVQTAARSYWVTTGTTGLIEAQIDRHRAQFTELAQKLLRNYELTKLNEDADKTMCEPPHVPLNSTQLNLISLDQDQFSEPGLLTLCLFAGYLTRHSSTSVCIPNHEVYQVWLKLFARAVMGAEMADNSTNYERGALLSELWRGKTNILRNLAISSHGVLSNHNKFLEADYANHFANTIVAVSRFGMVTHPKQPSIQLSDMVPIRENHTGLGKCDYVMRLYSTDNVANQFGVVVEFKLIENHQRSNAKHHKACAERGLRQIAERNYDSCLYSCLERMDIGVAIGNNVVYAVSKLYRRESEYMPWKEVDSLV